jgi:Tfp pilus assembly protein PilF
MGASVFVSLPMLESIMAALRGGDYAAAAASARELLAAEPDHAEALHLLALALRQLGELDAAEAAIDRALELAPDRAGHHIARAVIATQRRDADAARTAFDAALKQDPNQLIAYIGLAQIAFATRDLAAAEQHLRYAERLDPEHPHVLTLSAQLALARSEPQLALGLLARAASAAPEDVMVQGTYGLTLLSQRHFAFAEQALRNALALHPQARSLRHALMQALIGQSRPVDAEREADALLAQHGDDPHTLTLKGQLAAARGARVEAETHLMRALELQPGLHLALDTLLRLWVTNREHARAEAYVDALVARAPQHDGNWSALLELQRVQPQRAAQTALRWQSMRPDSVHANELAAQVSEANGDFARANELAQRTATLDPQRATAQMILIRTELREGRAAAARARIEPLLQAQTEPAARRTLNGWLGRACDAAGDPAAAVKAWRAGHALFDKSPPLPELVPPDAELRAAIDAALEIPTRADPQEAPRLLWGAPGSGVERLVALLGGRSDGRVLIDRFGANARSDGFRLHRMGRKRAASPEQQATRFAQEWRDGLAAVGVSPRDVDWLPHLDARVLPLLLAGLPDTRLLVALRDPRDMLLNWLAFGTPQSHPIADPVVAARWLALALEQFLVVRERARPSLLVVRMRELEASPAQVAAEVAQFVGGDTPALDVLQRSRIGLGGLPTALPPGHWRIYEPHLREAFELLEPIAARLGVD